MVERIYVVNRRDDDECDDVYVKEYYAPNGLKRKWEPTDINFGGSARIVAHIIAASLAPEDLCVFGFTLNVNKNLRMDFREYFIEAVRKARGCNGNF